MQTVIVDTIVALAAIYAVWRLLPSAGRRFVVARLAAALGSQRLARLEKRVGSGGCGGCDSCGGCPPAEGRQDSTAAEQPVTLHRR